MSWKAMLLLLLLLSDRFGAVMHDGSSGCSNEGGEGGLH